MFHFVPGHGTDGIHFVPGHGTNGIHFVQEGNEHIAGKVFPRISGWINTKSQ
jgi:hypothetical protein